MKTYLECVNEAALKIGYKNLVEDLQVDNAEPVIDVLIKAADMYASQSNSHKPVVGGPASASVSEGEQLGNEAGEKGVRDWEPWFMR